VYLAEDTRNGHRFLFYQPAGGHQRLSPAIQMNLTAQLEK
jgi:hypothetical protein